MRFCLDCGKQLKDKDNICPNCGFDYQEFMNAGDCNSSHHTTIKKEKEPMFTQEQAFMMHIHPDDELYRKTMELNILGKNYKR